MKTFETMEPNQLMGYFTVVGNSAEIAKNLVEAGDTDAANKILVVSNHFMDYLLTEVQPQKVGICSVFYPGDNLTFTSVMGRIGWDSKAVHKALTQAVKKGELVVSGARRAKRYSLPV